VVWSIDEIVCGESDMHSKLTELRTVTYAKSDLPCLLCIGHSAQGGDVSAFDGFKE
jgi:hypothetical protein